MRNAEISKYLSKLNNGSGKDTIFTRPLSKNVDLGRVWEKMPKPTDEMDYSGSYKLFFIKSEEGEYIGAVVDMCHDLHWFIKPAHRKKGYLSKALRSTILPYLFYERDEQRISIDAYQIGEINYSNSRRVAELLGFKIMESNHQKDIYVLSKTEFDWSHELLEEENTRIEKERADVLRKRISYVANLLCIIQEELEMKYGDCLELDEIIRDVKNYSLRIDNFFEMKTH